jgi:general stress protein CsbA
MGKKRRRKQKPSESSERRISPALCYGLLAAVVLFFGLIRVRLLSFPLERDEGEYAYAGQLILRGIAPYRFCYTMKLPGTAAAYALIEAIFGHSPTSIHLGLLFANSATTVLIFFLAKRLFGSLGGVVSCAAYGLLSLEPAVLGWAGHATHFVVLPATAGILLLLKADELQKLPLFFSSGFLLGLAFLMKQPGIFFVFFGMFWVVYSARRRRQDWRRWTTQLAAFVFAATLPFLGTCLLVLAAGVFPKFWFWTFTYAREYGTLISVPQGLNDLLSTGSVVTGAAPLIWLFAATGLVVIFFDPKTRLHFVFIASLLAFSFAAVCPGLYFREHYFVLLLPVVSLLCGGAVIAGSNLLAEFNFDQAWQNSPIVLFLFLFCFVFSVIQQRAFFFFESPLALCRKIYRPNPFAEAVEMADFIKSHSSPADRIAVIGSEPEIYFYADRLSATGYIYMYPLMEEQPFASTMQKEMISEIETAQPRFVVFVDTKYSWLSRESSDMTIFHWSDQYAQKQYRLVGLADMFEDRTTYRWDHPEMYKPRSPNRVFLFARN